MPTKPIAPFKPGDSKRTPLSAKAINAIVAGLNEFLRLRAGPGIKITRADAGWVIAWAPESPGETLDDPNTTPGGGGDGGSISFRGEWDDSTEYNTDDIVWRASDADLSAGKGGTFISKTTNTNSEPPAAGLGDYENSDWKVFAPFQAFHDYWIDPSESGAATEINGGVLKVTGKGDSPTQTFSVVIDPRADIYLAGVSVSSLELRLMPVTVCVDGEEKTLITLGYLIP